MSIDNKHISKGDQNTRIEDNNGPFIARSNTFLDRADPEIWKAFKEAHEGAFSFIYDHYFDVLFQYGCQLTQDTGLVEDMLQDFFVELRLKRQRLTDVACIKAYLLKSFRRKMIRQLRKKKHLLFGKEAEAGHFNINYQYDLQFIRSQFQEEQQKMIHQLLNRLTRREREAIYHFYFENLDYQQVSLVMGLSSAKSARNLIYKALSVLKKKRDLFPIWLRSLLLVWL